VLISSISVYLPAPNPIMESNPTGGTDDYGKSKAGSEEVVRDYGAPNHMEWVILRPCVIYGERDTGTFPHLLLRLLRWPLVIISSDGWPALELVHAEDVASAALLAGRNEKAAGQIYNVTGGMLAGMKEIAKVYGEVSGRKRRVITIPAKVLKAVLRARMHSIRRYSIEKAKREIHYQPQVSLNDGLRRTLQWFGASA
jgi:nucleoside-diphosphate-sugar epimerase